MHILLIEPDTLQANVYKAAREKQNHTVAHVATAQSAVQCADERKLHLRRKPTTPRERTWILVASGTVRPDWEPYLGVSSATLSA